MMGAIDAAVVGAGPNGLAAAVTLARAGLNVHLFERAHDVGGACRTETWGEGYRSDWGAAVHPMALASPFFRELRIAEHLKFSTPQVSIAHPLDGGAALVERSLDATVHGLGRDGPAWQRLVGGLLRDPEDVIAAALGAPVRMLERPRAASRLAVATLRAWAGAGCATPEARALLAGIIAHSVGVQPGLGVSAAGVVLAALAHRTGWPIPHGGSGQLTHFLAAEFRAAGGTLHLGRDISSMRDLPPARTYLFDTSGRALCSIAGDRVSPRYARALRRARLGGGVSRVDLVLSEPIPWAAERVGEAGTVHVCGSMEEVREAERAVARGQHAENPMIVLSQPSLFDPTRAPAGQHVVWAYAHVPTGSSIPQTEQVIRSLERFAPGVRDLVRASRSMTAREIGERNPAMPGGDFASGAITAPGILARPVLSSAPWRAGAGIYLCSGASTPGPGVHGMAGYGAARAALSELGIAARRDRAAEENTSNKTDSKLI